jgi:hypothetical protein
MSERLHPGQHPDADQLSAFAEHVLPEHERLETLAHLAVCEDCRQIVFLAQQAHEAEAPVPHALPSRGSWLRNWRYLWPVAAAATCGLLIFPLLLRRRPVDAPQRPAIGSASRPPLPTSSAQLPEPIVAATPPSRMASSKAKVPSSSHPASAAATHANVGIGSVNGSLPAPRVANNLSAFDSKETTVDQQSSPSLPANGQAMGLLSASVPQAAPSQVQKDNLLTARQQQPTTALQSQPQLFPQQASLPRVSNDPVHGEIQQSANQAVSVEAAPPVVQTESAVLSASSFSEKVAKAKTAKAPLPSNRPAASTISNGVETLAVDSAGDLFISKDDADIGWQRVVQQWTGKAVRVTLALPAATTQPARSASQSANARTSKSVEAVTPTTAAKRVGFDLVTDSGTIWSSPDGFVWKQR